MNIIEHYERAGQRAAKTVAQGLRTIENLQNPAGKTPQQQFHDSFKALSMILDVLLPLSQQQSYGLNSPLIRKP